MVVPLKTLKTMVFGIPGDSDDPYSASFVV